MFIATPGLTGVLDGERIESNVEKQGGFAGLDSRFPRLHEYRRMFQNLGRQSPSEKEARWKRVSSLFAQSCDLLYRDKLRV